MTAPFRDPATAIIGLALIGGALITWAIFSGALGVVIGRMLARGPYLDDSWDDFETAMTNAPDLDVMPLHDRIAHDEMASFFVEWDERCKEERA